MHLCLVNMGTWYVMMYWYKKVQTDWSNWEVLTLPDYITVHIIQGGCILQGLEYSCIMNSLVWKVLIFFPKSTDLILFNVKSPLLLLPASHDDIFPLYLFTSRIKWYDFELVLRQVLYLSYISSLFNLLLYDARKKSDTSAWYVTKTDVIDQCHRCCEWGM